MPLTKIPASMADSDLATQAELDAAVAVVAPGIQGSFKRLKIVAQGLTNTSAVITADELMLESASNTYAIAAPNTAYGGTLGTNPPPWYAAAIDNGAGIMTGAMLSNHMPLETSNIHWASSAAAGRLFCSGWEDNL